MSEDAHQSSATEKTPEQILDDRRAQQQQRRRNQQRRFIQMFYSCPRCGRNLSHSSIHGYFCEYCAGIED